MQTVYSMKADPVDIEGARKFFARVRLPLQDAMRAQMKMAADCEQCLQLVETDAPTEQVQSVLAGILANAKKTWHLNGLFRDAVLKTAEAAKLPDSFIANVLAEAERINSTKEPG